MTHAEQIKKAVDRLRDIREEYGYLLNESRRIEAYRLCNQLVDLGYWPAQGNRNHPTPAHRMWDCYGLDWHIFKGPLQCPHCKADLCDHENGPPFKREIGVIQNDRLHHYKCPDCGEVI